MTGTPGGTPTTVFVLCFLIFPLVSESAGRTRRELKFPKGASVGLTAALATHFPKGPLTDGLAHVIEFEFGFPFPEEVAYSMEPGQDIKKKIWNEVQHTKTKYQRRRDKRDAKEIQKESLLKKMENVVTRLGHDGFACVSRFQCELQQISAENSLLEEILIALFKPPYFPDEQTCDAFASDCPLSLLHIFLHSQQKIIQ